MEISPYKFNLPGADPKPDFIHVVSLIYFIYVHNSIKNSNKYFVNKFQASCPDSYRGKYNQYNTHPEDLKMRYAEEVEQIIKQVKSNGKGIAAFIAESLQSCGGQIIPPEGYFKSIYEYEFNSISNSRK